MLISKILEESGGTKLSFHIYCLHQLHNRTVYQERENFIDIIWPSVIEGSSHLFLLQVPDSH